MMYFLLIWSFHWGITTFSKRHGGSKEAAEWKITYCWTGITSNHCRAAMGIYFFSKMKCRFHNWMKHLKPASPPNNSPSRILWENHCCWTVNLIGFLMANSSQREEWWKWNACTQVRKMTQSQKKWIKVVGRMHSLTCTFVSPRVRDYDRSLF